MLRRIRSLVLTLYVASIAACTPSDVDDPAGDADALPAFEEDCGNARNNSLDTASGLEAEDENEWRGVRLCTDDLDYYRVDVPPGRWLSL